MHLRVATPSSSSCSSIVVNRPSTCLNGSCTTSQPSPCLDSTKPSVRKTSKARLTVILDTAKRALNSASDGSRSPR